MSKSIAEQLAEEKLWDEFEENMRAGFRFAALRTIDYAKYLGYDELVDKMNVAV